MQQEKEKGYFVRDVEVGSGKGQVAGACEYGNEILGCVKCGEFLD